MIPYIFHVGIIIGACFLFYKIFLQKETFYRINRWILLASLFLAFLLPLLPIPAEWSWTHEFRNKSGIEVAGPVNIIPAKAIPEQVVAAQQFREPAKSQAWLRINWLHWFYYCYLTGVIIFGFNLLVQLLMLLKRCYGRAYIQDGRFRIIETTGDTAPCSFASYIFINPASYDWQTYNQIIQHEKIHIQQRHTADILISEFVIVFQWFNPFAWFYRKQVENNLEYLTDEWMLHNGNVERKEYQMSLLKVSVPHLPLGITTNYNQSLLKKRIAMMNVKKSSARTAWKYFFFLPFLICFVCIFNQPVARAQSGPSGKLSAATENKDRSDRRGPDTEGSWFATIKKEKIYVDFKTGQDAHNWSGSTSFLLSEFSSLPLQAKGDFSLTRDAGTILFSGKFDGDLGYGHFSFKPDPAYRQFLEKQGVSNLGEEDMFACFMINVTKNYVEVLGRHGFTDISKDNLIALVALGVDEPYIRFWKNLRYTHLSAENLITSKSLGIDSSYISELQQEGYEDLDMDKLTSFKAQGITGEYISKLKKAKMDKGNAVLPSADEIMTSKAMDIDPAYIRSLAEAGYADVPYEQLFTLKSLGITADFIKSFEMLGYKKIPAEQLVSLKSMDITASFVKSFEDAGYKNIPLDQLVSMKSMGVKSDYIKGFKTIGFNNLSLDEIITLKAMDLTPSYINSMRKKGFDYKDINKYIELRSSFREVQ